MPGKRQLPDGSFPDQKQQATAQWGDLKGPVENGREFSWSDVDAALFQHAIAACTDSGAAVSFAVNRTRSGGSITILAGPERFKYYANSVTEAQALLTQIIQRA